MGWVAAALLLVGCQSDSEQPPAAEPAGRLASIVAVRTSDDDRSLFVTFDQLTGDAPCKDRSRTTAEDVDGRFVVRVQAVTRPDSAPPVAAVACTLEAGTSTLTVPLPEPLSSEFVVDASTDTSVPVIRGRTLLRPAELPPGWLTLWDMGVAPGQWRLSYGPDHHHSFELFQSMGDHIVETDVSPEAVTVRGRPGILYADRASGSWVDMRLEWHEGGATRTVEAIRSGEAVDEAALRSELFAFASGLE